MNSELSYADQLNPQPEPAAPAPQSFFSRLIGVYFSPGETFQEIGRAPRILIPMIVLALLTMATVIVVSQRISFEDIAMQRIDAAAEKNNTPPEQVEQQKVQTKKFMAVFKYVIPVFAAVFSIVMALAFAGLAKLVSSMMGIENNFKSLLAVTVYSLLSVSIISSIVATLLLYLKPVEQIDPNNPVSSNLAALLSLPKNEHKFLNAFLAYVDVFYIWKVVLLGIGFAAVSRKLKTSTAVTYVSVVAILIALIGAAWTAAFS